VLGSGWWWRLRAQARAGLESVMAGQPHSIRWRRLGLGPTRVFADGSGGVQGRGRLERIGSTEGGGGSFPSVARFKCSLGCRYCWARREVYGADIKPVRSSLSSGFRYRRIYKHLQI
jgi:hypothetical protein